MVRNRIKVMRAEAGISATALSERMPEGVDKIVMSFIETGRVLPTRDSLETMCEIFDCTPTDLYNRYDIDLCAVRAQQTEQTPTTVKATSLGAQTSPPKATVTFRRNGAGCDRHYGMAQLRVWMLADEKAALFKAVNALGYHSVAEWLREMYRTTLHKYITLKLQDTTIHENITPASTTTCNQTTRS